jgi:hypothetical protein
MTVRMTDGEGNESTADLSVPRPYEQRLFLEVTTIAERLERPVHLLIVPSRSVVDAIVATVLQLRSTEIFCGRIGDAVGWLGLIPWAARSMAHGTVRYPSPFSCSPMTFRVRATLTPGRFQPLAEACADGRPQ